MGSHLWTSPEVADRVCHAPGRSIPTPARDRGERMHRIVLLLPALLLVAACGSTEPAALEPTLPPVPADLCAVVPEAARTGLTPASNTDLTGNPTSACSLSSPDGAATLVRAVVTVTQYNDPSVAGDVARQPVPLHRPGGVHRHPGVRRPGRRRGLRGQGQDPGRLDVRRGARPRRADRADVLDAGREPRRLHPRRADPPGRPRRPAGHQPVPLRPAGSAAQRLSSGSSATATNSSERYMFEEWNSRIGRTTVRSSLCRARCHIRWASTRNAAPSSAATTG